jgi:hypothetical protein
MGCGGGAAIIVKSDKNEVRDYLLGRLPEADQEQFEIRLLSDAKFAEEFDIVVDEITDEYLQNDLARDDRERVKKYFLSSIERQKKLEFAAELLRRAESRRVTSPGFLEQVTAFWRQPSFARFALAAVAVVVVVGIIYVLKRTDNASYLALSLALSTAERAEGPAAQQVKLPPNTDLKITLTIPESARGAKEYSAKLAGGSDLKIEQQTPETVTVTISAGSITPGTYAIQLFKDTKERIPGSYYFAVE